MKGIEQKQNKKSIKRAPYTVAILIPTYRTLYTVMHNAA